MYSQLKRLPNQIPNLFGISVALLVSASLYDNVYTSHHHRAVMFNKIGGVEERVIGEGTKLEIPWLQFPTIYEIRPKPKVIRSLTGTKDLQMVVYLYVFYQNQKYPNYHKY